MGGVVKERGRRRTGAVFDALYKRKKKGGSESGAEEGAVISACRFKMSENHPPKGKGGESGPKRSIQAKLGDEFIYLIHWACKKTEREGKLKKEGSVVIKVIWPKRFASER